MPLILDPLFGQGKGLVLVAGTFFPDAANAPTTTTGVVGTMGAAALAAGQGIGWSVVRTSAGLFTVTLSPRFPVCVAKLATLQFAAAGNVRHVQMGTYTASTGALQIRVVDAAAAVADFPAADANNSISFLCLFSRHASVR